MTSTPLNDDPVFTAQVKVAIEETHINKLDRILSISSVSRCNVLVKNYKKHYLRRGQNEPLSCQAFNNQAFRPWLRCQMDSISVPL